MSDNSKLKWFGILTLLLLSPVILGILLSNLNSPFAYVPFALSCLAYPSGLVHLVIELKGAGSKEARIIFAVFLILIFYFYWRQREIFLVEYYLAEGESVLDIFFEFIGRVVFFVFMSIFLSTAQIGSIIAEAVNFSSLLEAKN